MKAVVLEAKGRRALVLTADGAFLRRTFPRAVRVGEEVELPQASQLALVPRLALAALLLALLAYGGLRQIPLAFAQTVAYVDVAAGTDVRLGVAANGSVTEVLVPPAASGRVRALALTGEPLPRAVGRLIRALPRRGAVLLAAYPLTGNALPAPLGHVLVRALHLAARTLPSRRPIVTVVAGARLVHLAGRKGLAPPAFAVYTALKAKGVNVSLAALKRPDGLERAVARLARVAPTKPQGSNMEEVHVVVAPPSPPSAALLQNGEPRASGHGHHGLNRLPTLVRGGRGGLPAIPPGFSHRHHGAGGVVPGVAPEAPADTVPPGVMPPPPPLPPPGHGHLGGEAKGEGPMAPGQERRGGEAEGGRPNGVGSVVSPPLASPGTTKPPAEIHGPPGLGLPGGVGGEEEGGTHGRGGRGRGPEGPAGEGRGRGRESLPSGPGD